MTSTTTTSWIARAARMTVFGLGVSACIGGFAWTSARGQVDQEFLDIGADVMRYRDADWQGDVRELHLNQQRMFASLGVTNRSVANVLDHFEGVCEGRDGGMGEALAAIATSRPASRANARWAIRRELGDEGYVACIDVGERELPFAELTARLRRFQESNDVHDLGNLRYAYAHHGRQEGDGVMFVAMWTEGSFDLDAMMPETGDAPGVDVDGVARPPAARRTMTISEAGVDHRATFYEGSSMSAWELAAFYRTELANGGYHLLVDPPTHEQNDDATLVAERDGQMLYVTVGHDRGGHGRVTLLSDE